MDPANWRSTTSSVSSSTSSTASCSTSTPSESAETQEKVRQIEEFDFTWSSSEVPDYGQAREFKVFRIVRKDGVQVEELIRIVKKESDSILKKIGK